MTVPSSPPPSNKFHNREADAQSPMIMSIYTGLVVGVILVWFSYLFGVRDKYLFGIAFTGFLLGLGGMWFVLLRRWWQHTRPQGPPPPPPPPAKTNVSEFWIKHNQDKDRGPGMGVSELAQFNAAPEDIGTLLRGLLRNLPCTEEYWGPAGVNLFSGYKFREIKKVLFEKKIIQYVGGRVTNGTELTAEGPDLINQILERCPPAPTIDAR